MRRHSPTNDAIKIVRGLPATYKVIIAIASILAVLYGGVRFVVDISIDKALDRYERERQKIGRPEYTANKEAVKKEIDKLNDKLEKLDDRVDQLPRGR
jgi:hypothetical protein